MSLRFSSDASSSASVFSLELHPRYNAGTVRNVVQQVARSWSTGVLRQLNALVALPRGWDGYRAGPVRFDTANFALQLLESACGDETPCPQIIPGSDGDLQIEWHLPGGDVELHVAGPLRVSAWSSIGGVEEHAALTNDFTVAAQWLCSLAEHDGAAAAAA